MTNKITDLKSFLSKNITFPLPRYSEGVHGTKYIHLSSNSFHESRSIRYLWLYINSYA